MESLIERYLKEKIVWIFLAIWKWQYVKKYAATLPLIRWFNILWFDRRYFWQTSVCLRCVYYSLINIYIFLVSLFAYSCASSINKYRFKCSNPTTAYESRTKNWNEEFIKNMEVQKMYVCVYVCLCAFSVNWCSWKWDWKKKSQKWMRT